MSDDRYELWEPRAREIITSLSGLALIAWEATRISPSRDLLAVGIVLVIAPKLRAQILRAALRIAVGRDTMEELEEERRKERRGDDA